MITAYIYIYSRISAGDNSYLSPELRSQEYLHRLNSCVSCDSHEKQGLLP